MSTAAVHPEKILRDLNELWAQLDEDQSGAGGVLRACAMTLVVTANDEADAEEVRRTLGVLMHDHPARAVILKTQAGADLQARVFAECWKPFGSSQQICAEGVEVVADLIQLEDAAQFLVPLKVPDLPAVLWCRGPSVFHLRSFDMLFPVADKIIFDSSTESRAAATLCFLRNLRARGFHVADLHWTRLTGWREILAHLFDDGVLGAADVKTARVVYGGATPSTCALYFASWIEEALPRARVTMTGEAGEPGLHSVSLATNSGDTTEARGAGVVLSGAGRSAPVPPSADSREISLTRDGAWIEVEGCGRHYRAALPPMDEESLMREELKFLGPDPVYDRVLA